MTATIRYSIINRGTPAFPIYSVWQDPEDENGFTIEHECSELAHFTTYSQAVEFLDKLQNK